MHACVSSEHLYANLPDIHLTVGRDNSDKIPSRRFLLMHFNAICGAAPSPRQCKPCIRQRDLRGDSDKMPNTHSQHAAAS
eukprot:scaffold205527_cov15-Prasinocladus_malaysianus.AAC.1